jgi:hypothetical protein
MGPMKTNSFFRAFATAAVAAVGLVFPATAKPQPVSAPVDLRIEFDRPVKELRSRLLFEQHVFTGASGQNVIRLLPPLVLTKDLADEFIKRFKAVL